MSDERPAYVCRGQLVASVHNNCVWRVIEICGLEYAFCESADDMDGIVYIIAFADMRDIPSALCVILQRLAVTLGITYECAYGLLRNVSDTVLGSYQTGGGL